MSTYSVIEGSITFPNAQTMNTALAPLIKGGWLVDNVMYSEEGQPADLTAKPSVDGLTLTLPYADYLNLNGQIQGLVNLSSEAEVSEVGEWYATTWYNDKFDSKDDEEVLTLLHDNRMSEKPFVFTEGVGKLYRASELMMHNLKQSV